MDADRALKKLFRLRAPELLALTGDRGARVESRLVPELNAVTRRLDFVMRLKRGREVYLRHLEFEMHFRGGLARRVFEYAAALASEHHLPVASTAIILKAPAPRALVYEERVRGRLVCWRRIPVLRLWKEGSVQGPVGCIADAFRGAIHCSCSGAGRPERGRHGFELVCRGQKAEPGRGSGQGPRRGDDRRTTSCVPRSRRSAPCRESAARRTRHRGLLGPGSPAGVGARCPAALRRRVSGPRERTRPGRGRHWACTPSRARPRAAPGTARPLLQATLTLGLSCGRCDRVGVRPRGGNEQGPVPVQAPD